MKKHAERGGVRPLQISLRGASRTSPRIPLGATSRTPKRASIEAASRTPERAFIETTPRPPFGISVSATPGAALWIPVCFTLILFGFIGCANMKAPTGGPADKDSPFIESSVPDSGAVGVARLDSLAFTFSEPMDRRSVEDEFRVTPPVRFRAKEWRELSWILRLEAPLDTATTYVAHFGRNTTDRRDNTFDAAVSIPFSTGAELDAGRVEGKVIGARFRPQGLDVYVWPWADGAPDTTDSYYPTAPIRIGQTSAEGEFRIDHLPSDVPLRICAFFDRDDDGRYQPFPDRWACTEEPIVLVDSTRVQSDVEIYLAEDEEPGTLAGTVADSSCLRRDPRAELRAVRAERDSILEWLLGEWDSRQRGRSSLSPADSSRIEAELAALQGREALADADSALCARPIRVELTAADTVVSEVVGPSYKFTDVAPGIYRVRAYRDLNEDGVADEDEPTGAFPYAVEVAPLREIEDLRIELEDTLVESGSASSSSDTSGKSVLEGAPSDTLRSGETEGTP